MPSRVIWSQLVRAAPSASANLEEADEALSDADFVFRMKVATREMKEVRRWLRFIEYCRLTSYERLGDLPDEARQLASMFATIVGNTRRRIERERREKQRRQPNL